jgi:predicted NBD/HSP70 family sugar kinase
MRFGMDYGGTNVKVGVFTEAGEAVAFEQAPLRAFTSGDLLGNLVEHALRVAGGADLAAGGLAIKGLVDTTAGCVVEDIGEGSC